MPTREAVQPRPDPGAIRRGEAQAAPERLPSLLRTVAFRAPGDVFYVPPTALRPCLSLGFIEEVKQRNDSCYRSA